MPHFKLRIPKLSRKNLIIMSAGVLVCVAGVTTFALTRPDSVATQTEQPSSTPVKKPESKVAQQPQKPVEKTEESTAADTKTDTPPGNPSTPPLYIPPANTPPPFRVNYIYFDQAQSFCVGSTMEVISIHDARILLINSVGGQITYKFTVTGATNPYPEARSLAVPAGQTPVSIRQLMGSVAPGAIFEIAAYLPHPPIHIQLDINGKTANYAVPARAVGECP